MDPAGHGLLRQVHLLQGHEQPDKNSKAMNIQIKQKNNNDNNYIIDNDNHHHIIVINLPQGRERPQQQPGLVCELPGGLPRPLQGLRGFVDR